MRFRELAAFNNELDPRAAPEDIPQFLRNNVERTGLHDSRFGRNTVDELYYSGQVDVSYPFATSYMNGFVKAGAKVRNTDRDRQARLFELVPNTIRDSIATPDADLFEFSQDGRIGIGSFTGGYVPPRPFLQDRFFTGIGSSTGNTPQLDYQSVRDFVERYERFYATDDRQLLESYQAQERVSSTYLMTELNFFKNQLMLMGGARIERTDMDYGTTTGVLRRSGDALVLRDQRDTSNVRDYTEFLPMVHLRYKPVDWFDVRVAATKSLVRPDFINLVPWVRVDEEARTITRGNAELEHTTVWNYDLMVSFYGKFGLISAGGFYKELTNLSYLSTFRITDPQDANAGFQATEFRNANGLTQIRGVELDAQLFFDFLPGIWSSFLLTANATFLESKTLYPFFQREGNNPDPPFEPIFVQGERVGTMPLQPDQIFNVSLGFERWGFSARFSVVHQGRALFALGPRAEADSYVEATTRYDINLSKKLGEKWVVFSNLNNITNQPEVSFFGDPRFPTYEQYFGFTTDIGARYLF